MSENVKNIKKENTATEGVKSFFSEKNLAVIITAAVLVVIMLAAGIVALVQAITKDVWFDYTTANLDSYIEFTEDYKNFKINVDIAKPHDIDVDVSILNMLYADRVKNDKFSGTITSPFTISAGDVVNIWYRGYLLDDEGNQIAVEGMSNFADAPYALSIGSNGFIPGFELGLVGVNTGDLNKFERITTGAIKDDYIIYITYTIKDATDSKKDVTYSNVRLDLTTDLDATYGVGFKEKVMALAFCTSHDVKTTTSEGVEKTYSGLTVNFATDCERNAFTVETYFPYDYGKEDLRNETAYFEVYVTGVVDYTCPEFTDEYLKGKIEKNEINVTLEELDKYEGETLVAKYRDFAKKAMDELYELTYLSMVEEAIWNHYANIVKAKKYPGLMVDEMYEAYLDEITDSYITNGGYIYDSTTGQYKTYDSLEAYIPAYLGISSSTNWKTYVNSVAQDFIKERMTMYYILRAENLMPTKERLNEEYEEIRQEYLDEYIARYLNYLGKTEADYTAEEYQELVEECKNDLFGFYDEDYFILRAHYAVLAEAMVTWPEVVTLDQRRAYPLDK